MANREGDEKSPTFAGHAQCYIALLVIRMPRVNLTDGIVQQYLVRLSDRDSVLQLGLPPVPGIPFEADNPADLELHHRRG
jgi:hypothetical protein